MFRGDTLLVGIHGADVRSWISTAPIEAERTVNAVCAVGLAGGQRPVGYHFAGRRVTMGLDEGLLHLVDDGVLLRILPNTLSPAELARIRDARPAGPLARRPSTSGSAMA